MTGAISLYSSALGHAQFASARAPHNTPGFVYGALGAACSLAFTMGANHRSHAFKTIGVHQDMERIRLEKPNKTSIIEGLAVVIPALVKTDEEIEILQEAITASGKGAFVIVVDDGSPRPLASILKGCAVVRHEENRGPAAARNTGMSLALKWGASSIGFTDADCRPDLDWAKKHASLQASDPGIWAGRTVSAEPDSIFSEFHDHVGTLMPRLRTPTSTDALYAPTCNLSVSREVAESLSFDQTFPTSAFEDVDFCLRARLSHNFPVKVSDEPVVRHSFEPGLIGLVRSYHKYGRSYPLLLQRHPGYPQDLHQSMPLSAAGAASLPSHQHHRTLPGHPTAIPHIGNAPSATGGLVAWAQMISCFRAPKA